MDLPTARIRSRPPSIHGFTLIELLAVIGIIGVLVALLLPTLMKARQQSIRTKCAAQLRQVAVAFNGYLNSSRGMMFWRAPNVSIDGMDWYAYGGRETGNTNLAQEGLFNRFVPRPLNPYVGGNASVFRCPADSAETSPWAGGVSMWEYVGTSYNFNATGNPNVATHTIEVARGLGGQKVTRVRNSSATVVFLDAGLIYPGRWHGHLAGTAVGNIAFIDGHVEFLPRPDERATSLLWLD